MATFTIKHYYNLDTIAPTFIGSRYTNVKLMDILSFESAVKIRQDLVSINQKIKDNVLGAIELNAANLTYLKFIDTTGQTLILAKEWLDNESVVDLTELGGYKRVTIEIKGSLDDIAIINNALKNLGYHDFTITAKDYV